MFDWAIWGALIFSALAGTGALALLAARSLRAWRELKETQRDVIRRLGELQASGEAAVQKLEATGDTAELQERLGRLRISLARLAVLRAALGEAQETFGRITAVLPRN